MKKILSTLCLVTLLTGCGVPGLSSSGKNATVTCRQSEDNIHYEMIAKAPSKNKDIEHVEVKVSMDVKDLGMTEEMLKDEKIKNGLIEAMDGTIEQSLNAQFDLKSGFEVDDISFDGTILKIKVSLDVKENKDSFPDNMDFSLKGFKVDFEEAGFKCE